MIATWTWIRGKLKQSSRLVTVKKAIWATSRRIGLGSDGRIIEEFPLFVPASQGRARNVRTAHRKGF